LLHRRSLVARDVDLPLSAILTPAPVKVGAVQLATSAAAHGFAALLPLRLEAPAQIAVLGNKPSKFLSLVIGASYDASETGGYRSDQRDSWREFGSCLTLLLRATVLALREIVGTNSGGIAGAEGVAVTGSEGDDDSGCDKFLEKYPAWSRMPVPTDDAEEGNAS